MNRRAQGISMNVIIVSVIALIVLVVMIFIFNDKIAIFGKGVSSCSGICEGSLNSNTGYSICEGIKGIKKYTFNPAGKCLTDNKEDNRACCVEVKLS